MVVCTNGLNPADFSKRVQKLVTLDFMLCFHGPRFLKETKKQ